MTLEDEVRFTEKLRQEYILIPKGRAFQFVGGAVAVLIAAFGINTGTVLAYMRTRPAQTERDEIKRIHDEVKNYYGAMGAGMFVTRNEAAGFLSKSDGKQFLQRDEVFLIAPFSRGPKALVTPPTLHVHNDSFVNGAAVNLSTDRHQGWQLVALPVSSRAD